MAILFFFAVIAWFAWFIIKTSADRANNHWVEKVVRTRIPTNGYATEDQRRAAMEEQEMVSDDGEGDAVLMPNLTKKRR